MSESRTNFARSILRDNKTSVSESRTSAELPIFSRYGSTSFTDFITIREQHTASSLFISNVCNSPPPQGVLFLPEIAFELDAISYLGDVQAAPSSGA